MDSWVQPCLWNLVYLYKSAKMALFVSLISTRSSKDEATESPHHFLQTLYAGSPWSRPLCKFNAPRSNPRPWASSKRWSRTPFSRWLQWKGTDLTAWLYQMTLHFNKMHFFFHIGTSCLLGWNWPNKKGFRKWWKCDRHRQHRHRYITDHFYTKRFFYSLKHKISKT